MDVKRAAIYARYSSEEQTGGESIEYQLERCREYIADQGWLGAVYPEEYGGLGLSYADFICIAEEFGKGVIPEPLNTVAGLAGNAVLFAGTEEQKQEILPQDLPLTSARRTQKIPTHIFLQSLLRSSRTGIPGYPGIGKSRGHRYRYPLTPPF